MESPTEFELEMWEKDARRLVMCTGCYGVGQRQSWGQDNWVLCDRCKGHGKAEAELHTLQLVAEIRRLKGQHTSAWERGAAAMRQTIADAVQSMYDNGAYTLVLKQPIPTYTEERHAPAHQDSSGS